MVRNKLFNMLIFHGTLGYYFSNETTDDDILEFLASMTLSEYASFGVNYTFRIIVLIDKIEFLNTTVILTPRESPANVRSKINKNKLCNINEIYFTCFIHNT